MALFIISQNNTSNGEGFGGYQVMYLTPDFTTLNNAFQTAHYDSINFSGGIYTQGGGGYAVSNGILIGGFGFNGSIVSESDSISIKSEFSGGFFELGVSIFKSALLNIYPLLGIGTSNVKLNLRTIQKDETFQNILSNPARLSTIKTGGFTIEPAIIFQFWLKGKKTQPLSILIKFSYLYLPKKTDWIFDDGTEILGGPNFKPGGFAITSGIFLGGG